MLSPHVSIQFRGEWPNYSCVECPNNPSQLPIYTFIVMRGCEILLETAADVFWLSCENVMYSLQQNTSS